jgi:predicted enzyme related to lactoylglutathione lyase
MFLRGLATISFYADDVEAAREWYTELLGIAPYFVRPETGPAAYIEFRLGDFEHELGIIDRRYSTNPTATAPGGALVFWHVDDVEQARERLIARGATEYEPIVQREAGFVTASVVDPFGNILGIMYNPHYLEILEFRTGGMLGE